jgi:uncharacterized protein (TIRG00374 family)
MASLKKAALTCLQVTVTIGLLWFVFRDPKLRAEIATALTHAHLEWLVAGLAVYGATELLAGVRWQFLLRVQGIYLGWIRLLTLMMIGIFFNFFVPGGTGGDVVKVFYLLKETPGRGTHALLSVLVDRIIGVFSLVIIAGVVLTLRWRWLMSSPETAQYVWLALAVLGAVVSGLLVSFILTSGGLVHRRPARFPARDKLAEFALAYNSYGRAWRTTGPALLLSVLSNFGYFATFYCAARAFSAPGVKLPSLLDLCAVMPIVNTITSLPISFGGIGVREGLFHVFLGNLLGVSKSIAVAISSTGYLLTLTFGLIGGVLYLLYRPTDHPKLREMRAEVGAFEHDVAEAEVAVEAARETGRL